MNVTNRTIGTRGPIGPRENICGTLVQYRRGYRWWYLDDQYGLGPNVREYSGHMCITTVNGVRHLTRRIHIADVARIRFRQEDDTYSEQVEVIR
jgi:hypothetical protein